VSDLQRLVLKFKPGELLVHTLCRNEVGSKPGTKARSEEVSNLVYEGLTQVLTALEGGRVNVVGVSGDA
jgi:hypothetical protein